MRTWEITCEAEGYHVVRQYINGVQQPKVHYRGTFGGAEIVAKACNQAYELGTQDGKEDEVHRYRCGCDG